MQILLDLLNSVGGYIFGAGGLLSILLFYSQNKRFKRLEVDGKEIESLKGVIAILKERIDTQESEIKRVQDRLASKDAVILAKDDLIDSLHRDKDVQMIKYSQKKRAIAEAYACQHAKQCPVLMELKKIESEYRERISKQTNKDNADN